MIEELNRATALTVHVTKEARPKNTEKAYARKQNEFSLWCDQKGYLDGRVVTEAKLNLFLHEMVIGRQSKR